jgi:hypothetical protein
MPERKRLEKRKGYNILSGTIVTTCTNDPLSISDSGDVDERLCTTLGVYATGL